MQQLKREQKESTTLLYNNGKFLIPGSKYNALKEEKTIEKLLKDSLKPMENDIIVIGSDDNNYITAELASKSAALQTLENHEDHKGLEFLIR